MATTGDKRLSLSIVAPRTLHLLDGVTPPSSAPLPVLSPVSPNANNRLGRPKPNIRRQSSISYRTGSTDEFGPRSPAVLSRSASTGTKQHERSIRGHGGRRSQGSLLVDDKAAALRNDEDDLREKPPLTLAEKHAELLHFIAQKESKCLDLRSELEKHEAELLQLKRKWERIVSRSFITPTSIAQPSSSAPPASPVPSGVVLEGIREGVQGVSRFIAEFSSYPSSPHTPTTKRSVVVNGTRKGHPTNNSTSSTSTGTSPSIYSTSTTARHSLSSASSLAEEWVHGEQDATIQELMVQDTGATPTMSPNPAYHRNRSCSPQPPPSSHPIHEILTPPPLMRTTSDPATAKMHRRKSRESSVNLLDSDFLPSTVGGEGEKSEHGEDGEDISKKSKRMSPLIASIPGSSWVASAGKRWEELQKVGTFTKNQKRASVLLSDVSQSIYSALSPSQSPGLPFTTPSPIGTEKVGARTLRKDELNGKQEKDPWSSLLDDDDDGGAMGGGDVMKPDVASPIVAPTSSSSKTTADEDEEWNW